MLEAGNFPDARNFLDAGNFPEAGKFPETFNLQLFCEAEKILEEVSVLGNLTSVDEPDDVFDGAGMN